MDFDEFGNDELNSIDPQLNSIEPVGFCGFHWTPCDSMDFIGFQRVQGISLDILGFY